MMNLTKSSAITPKVSVLIPCFNSEKYLHQCLTSLKKQTLKEIEFICINDGSHDSTMHILQKFQASDKRFIIIDKQNSGYGDSLNIGINLAKGEYIGIIEPDDFIESDMFDTLYQMAIQNTLDIARCSYFYYTQKNEKEQKWPNVTKNKVIQPIKHFPVFYQAPSVWANIYKRSWLIKNSIQFLNTPGASYQDTSFSFKAYFLAQRFMMTDACLLHYRLDNENSSIHDQKKIFCVMDEWAEIYRFMSSRPEKKRFINLLIELQHRIYIWNLGRLNGNGKKSFLSVWHQDAMARKNKDRIKLLDLSVLDLILELVILYCPKLMLLYQKDNFIIKHIRRILM